MRVTPHKPNDTFALRGQEGLNHMVACGAQSTLMTKVSFVAPKRTPRLHSPLMVFSPTYPLFYFYSCPSHARCPTICLDFVHTQDGKRWRSLSRTKVFEKMQYIP